MKGSKVRAAARSFGAASLLAASLALAAPASAASTFSDLFVFGDSLVDAGNIRAITGGAVPDPALGYFDGRFTNGLDYTDFISQRLFGTVTTASLAGGNNFAFGGARVVNHGDTIPDLEAQLGAYLARSGGLADADALYILNFGGNDVFGLTENNIGGADPAAYAAQVVALYAGAVDTLDMLGARNIFITGIPNFGNPIATALETDLQLALDALSLSDDTTLYRYSYLSFFGRIAADPASVGIAGPLDLVTPCLQARMPMPGIDCTGFFSFDGIHPTAQVQRAQFVDIARQFGFVSIPEPQTWAMLILGFGLTGSAIRRRQRAGAAAALPG